MSNSIDNNREYANINRSLVKALDDLLAVGDWEASMFLQVSAKKLHQLRDEAQRLLEECELQGVQTDQNRKLLVNAKKDGYVKAYISLYQASGTNVERWQNLLSNIKDYSLTRPIYKEEAHIKELIRSKADKQNEAYVVVLIREHDIIDMGPERASKDRFGHQLLTVKAGAVLPENILVFIHNNCLYHLQKGELDLQREGDKVS